MRSPSLLPLLPLAGALAACAQEQPRRYVLDATQQTTIEYPLRVEVDDTLHFPATVLARGDSIFHGQLRRGTCFTCHGDDARGGPITPDLTDNDWHHIDGSFASIRDLIIDGVPDYDPPMPPLGGAALGDDDIVAVAAYVFWLANRHRSPLRPADDHDHDHDDDDHDH